MINDVKKLEERIGYSFRNHELIMKAITHTSYAYEHLGAKGRFAHNQRLEFLGDSVLSTVISTYLYKHFKDMNEGSLSKLRASVVCEASLSQIAQSICLQEYLLLGHGEELSNGRSKASIQADAFESLIAAIYLDGGFESVTKVLMEKLDMENYILKYSDSYDSMDYKSKLQESVNTSKSQILYEIIDVKGPAHNCVYYAKVTASDIETHHNEFAEGSGKSKKDAEQAAAKCLLQKLGIIGSKD